MSTQLVGEEVDKHVESSKKKKEKKLYIMLNDVGFILPSGLKQLYLAFLRENKKIDKNNNFIIQPPTRTGNFLVISHTAMIFLPHKSEL